MLKDLLEQKNCFKLICGAGNEDVDAVEKLIAVYSAAGCNFFDICADTNVIKAAKRGLSRVKTNEKKYLCISVGTSNDIHFQKARIDKTICLGCFNCVSSCPQKAINTKLEVNTEKCIGCGKCESTCPAKSIFFEEKKTDLKQMLSSLPLEEIDCIELHIGNEKDSIEKWNILQENFPKILSICIGRKYFSNEEIKQILKKLLQNRKPYSTIIQADGTPMSGGNDDYATTLQAVATGNLIQNENLKQFLILSGGTNSKTKELSEICSVNINGVAVGSYARKIVSKYIDRPDFWDNQQNFEEATSVARSFITKLFG